MSAIETCDLTKRFGDFTAVDRVNLEVAPGEVFGFLGSNGCGKSTTIRMLCGLLLPSGGEASVAGLDVRRQAEQIRQRVGYVAQFFNLYADLTVEENLRFYGGVYGVGADLLERVERWIARLSLGALRRQLAGELSTGQQRSLALAAAVLHQPAVLLLDEPTSGVDPLARREFFDVIGELTAAGATVLVTTHVMDEAERCHRLAIMNRGRIITEGTPKALKEAGAVERWKLAARPAAAALELAEQQPGVATVALFGEDLQFTLQAGAQPAALAAALRAAGLSCGEPEAVRSTIEHSFLELIRRDDAAAETRAEVRA
ncbi:MAG: ABC transporter ATP-binding protein [Fimbriimonadaceae bacterium]|nr:ABC transporter ATP-binding protein [Fimbriimonadaceae bacterium]